jgi:hypothetical protein
LTYNPVFYVFNLSQGEFLSLLKACKSSRLKLFAPKGESAVIETKAHSKEIAALMISARSDSALPYLGNYFLEIWNNEKNL